MDELNERPTHRATRLARRLAIATVVLTIVTFALALTAIPDAGPHCMSDCVEYPFTSERIADQFPGDYLWMYPAMLLSLALIALLAAIHERTDRDRRVFSLLALVVGSIAASVLLVDYFVQVTVLQPSLEKGQLDGWSMLTQYNPNGIFIALEELGYLLMSVALAALAPAFVVSTRIERSIRWLFVGGLVASVASLAYVSARHGIDRQDLYEVPAISIAWLTLIIGGTLIAIVLHRAERVDRAGGMS